MRSRVPRQGRIRWSRPKHHGAETHDLRLAQALAKHDRRQGHDDDGGAVHEHRRQPDAHVLVCFEQKQPGRSEGCTGKGHETDFLFMLGSFEVGARGRKHQPKGKGGDNRAHEDRLKARQRDAACDYPVAPRHDQCDDEHTCSGYLGSVPRRLDCETLCDGCLRPDDAETPFHMPPHSNDPALAELDMSKVCSRAINLKSESFSCFT